MLVLSGFAFIIPCSPAFSQCCSSGSPTGASTFIGLLNKNTLHVISFYRNSFSDVYYKGSVKDTDYAFVKNSSFDYVGLSVGYGLTKKITAEYEMGYFISKIQRYNLTPEYLLKGYGLSNGSILLKYGLLVKPAKNIEITAGTGIKFPFTMEPQYVNNVKLPRDIQPSTGAFGFTSQLFFNKGFPSITLRVFSLNKYEINGANSEDYRYGNFLMNSLFISKKICNNFFGIIQFRSDNRQPDRYNKVVFVNSGSEVIFVSPHLSYSISGKWHIDILTDFPVYKNYVGKQLTPKYSYAISLTRDFNNCVPKEPVNQK
ncbi:MAG: hypothetical protein WC599_08270 [Bacteroidales bacterium]